VPRFVEVATSAEIPEGSSKVVRVEGKTIALWRANSQVYAMSNSCLHRGGPLAEGELDGYEVVCPWHGWTYDVRSGSFTVIPTLKLKTYPARVEGDRVLVDLDA